MVAGFRVEMNELIWKLPYKQGIASILLDASGKFRIHQHK